VIVRPGAARRVRGGRAAAGVLWLWLLQVPEAGRGPRDRDHSPWPSRGRPDRFRDHGGESRSAGA